VAILNFCSKENNKICYTWKENICDYGKTIVFIKLTKGDCKGVFVGPYQIKCRDVQKKHLKGM
jgi:hypothetical protein